MEETSEEGKTGDKWWVLHPSAFYLIQGFFLVRFIADDNRSSSSSLDSAADFFVMLVEGLMPSGFALIGSAFCLFFGRGAEKWILFAIGIILWIIRSFAGW